MLPPPLRTERAKLDDFYAARSGAIPPLPWQTFPPPFSLPPGRRSSYPHAESHEEEFVYALEGTPDVWLDGTLYRLKPGDAVGFPPGTGQSHTFINNSDAEIRLLVVGQTPLPENRIIYPRNPERRPMRKDWWDDAPERPDGGHDGLPDEVRAKRK